MQLFIRDQYCHLVVKAPHLLFLQNQISITHFSTEKTDILYFSLANVYWPLSSAHFFRPSRKK